MVKKLVKIFFVFIIKNVLIYFGNMVINAFRNKRYGPGGGTQHLHQIFLGVNSFRHSLKEMILLG